MRYTINNIACCIGRAPWFAFDAGNARLKNEGKDRREGGHAELSAERFTALSALAEVLREIHEELLAKGINLLEDNAISSHPEHEDE